MKATRRLPLNTSSSISLFLLSLLFFTATSAYCTTESTVQTAPRKVVAVIPADLPPTYFRDQSGKAAGFSVDVMDELARRTGLTVEYVHGQAWNEVIQMVLNGNADLIPCLTIDERRKELLALTDSVELVPINLIVANENHKVTGIAPGLTIGVVKGSVAEYFLKKNQTIVLKTYSHFQTLLFDLLAGHVDGIVTVTPNMMKMAAEIGVDDKVKAVGKPIIEARRGIALRKGDTELLTRLNKAIGDLIGSPEYQQIYLKWYGKPKPYWTAGRVGAVSGILVFIIMLFMAFWRYRSIIGINDKLTRSIAERIKAEEALQESESKYRNIFNNAIEGIYQSTPDGRFLSVNPSFARMCGYDSPEELIASINDIGEQLYVNPQDRDKWKELLMGRGAVENFETQFYRKDGSKIWVSFSAHIVKDGQGKIHCYEGAMENITASKQAEEEKRSLEERLNRAEKMEALGTLAGGVAHDLNNVLGIVVGYAEMTLDEVDKTSPLRPGLVNIMNGGQRAAAIVDDLLTLARRGVTGRSILNLNKIIADCQKTPEFVNLSFHHSSVKIKTDIDPDLLNISGSSIHLSKTLYNLVANASEAMAKGGIVTIKTANQYLDKPIQGYDQVRDGDYVVLSVSDTGEGIHEADMKRIFEPFYTKKVMGRSGTGLGLAVVWGTVKDHHGYINVQSEEGKGSTFTLYFPVTREGIAAERVALAISEYMGKDESILIVDDVKEQRDLAAGMLRTLNYNVSSVSSGEEAVAYIQDHEVDLIVLDMIMDPGMDGLDTYRSVLEIRPKQKAIIVSGFSESDRVLTARELGSGAYVRKPYIKEKLGLAVRKELDRT